MSATANSVNWAGEVGQVLQQHVATSGASKLTESEFSHLLCQIGYTPRGLSGGLLSALLRELENRGTIRRNGDSIEVI